MMNNNIATANKSLLPVEFAEIEHIGNTMEQVASYTF